MSTNAILFLLSSRGVDSRHRPHRAWTAIPLQGMSSPAIRLDDLPEGSLRNIVRHISSVPSQPAWTRFVDCEDARSVLRLGTSISDTARALFSRVHVGLDEISSNYTNPGTMFLRVNDESISVLTNWIEFAGQSQSSLTLGNSYDPFDPDLCQDMLTALKEKGPNLRRLDIQNVTMGGPLTDAVPAATHGPLQDLVAAISHAPAVENHCAGLRSLNMWAILSTAEN